MNNLKSYFSKKLEPFLFEQIPQLSYHLASSLDGKNTDEIFSFTWREKLGLTRIITPIDDGEPVMISSLNVNNLKNLKQIYKYLLN